MPDYTIDLGPGEFGPWFNHSAAVTRVLVLGSREPGCPCFEKPAAWGVQARALPDNATRLVAGLRRRPGEV